MANFHTDEWIMARLKEHYDEALEHFPENQIVGVFIQGSQNYGLDYEGSDIDTKLIIAPTSKEICLNKKPVSTTHVRANNEHTDWKDVRLYIETFYKQNLNFLEILFTDYYIINPLYEKEWNRLFAAREEIARMNPYRGVKSMKGIALEKYYAMEHEYPSKVDVLTKWGYDPKQLHHLLRVEEYLGRYMAGEPYIDCLHARRPEYLIGVKKGHYDLNTARIVANTAKANIERAADAFCAKHPEQESRWCRELLEDVAYNIIKIAIKTEIGEDK